MEKTFHFKKGDSIGNYQVLSGIGIGGMGEVYQAWDKELSRPVAIKIISENGLIDRNAVERFMAEGRALAKLNCPQIVSIYNFGEHQGLPFIVMEYVEGNSLVDFIIRNPCGLRDIIAIFREVVLGLQVIADQGIVHRDIKPQNIIISKDRKVKLVDFGIAKDYSEKPSVETTANIVMGTVNYLAPEVLMGEPATTRSDIFSLGLVFYFMLTGTTPFDAKTTVGVAANLRTQPLTLNSQLNLILPDDLKHILFKMTEKDPRNRYSHPSEILEVLDQVDLKHLPHDLLVTIPSSLEISNYDEIENYCEKFGLDSGEFRFVANLAVNLQQQRPTHANDMTEPISRNQSSKIVISKKAVDEALHRYRVAKGVVQYQRNSNSHKTPAKKSPTPSKGFNWSYGFIVIVGILAAWVFLRSGKPINKTEMSSLAPSIPRFLVGDQHILVSRYMKNSASPTFEEFRDVCEITSSSPGQITMNCQNGRVHTLSGNPFLPSKEIKFSTQDGVRSIQNTIFGNPFSIFPLEVGKRAENRIVGSEKLSDQVVRGWEYTYSCVVEKKEKVFVKLGEFLTFKVVCQSSGTLAETDTYYYAPAIERWIQRENIGPDNKEFSEMVSFQRRKE